MHAALVLVGAVNWEHPGWHAGFYPEGLPDDWLLSYYNTQFQAVYLPATVWQAASETTWKKWLDDTQEGFHFLLESSGTHDAGPASERVFVATPAWVAEHVWWLDEQPDMRMLSQRIAQHAQTSEPLFVLSRRGDLALLEQAKALKQVMGY